MEQKIIFSNSYSPRTGHNFVAEVFKIIVDAEVLTHHRSETRLSTILEDYYRLYDKHIYGEKDKSFFDYLLIDDLRNKIVSKSDKEFIIIKDTSFVGVKHIKKVFPDDIQILVIRDPLYTLKSGFKSIVFDKKGIKYKIQKLGTLIGIYPLYYGLIVSYKQIKSMPDLNDFCVIRYEDLVIKKDETLIMLKALLGSKKSLTEIKEGISDIKVINSSFTSETGATKIWEEKKVTRQFNPIDRKGHNFVIRTALKIGTYPLRKKLGYI